MIMFVKVWLGLCWFVLAVGVAALFDSWFDALSDVVWNLMLQSLVTIGILNFILKARTNAHFDKVLNMSLRGKLLLCASFVLYVLTFSVILVANIDSLAVLSWVAMAAKGVIFLSVLILTLAVGDMGRQLAKHVGRVANK